MQYTTLCYLENTEGQYLMMLRNRKKNDINEGKWIGVGGHIEPGEDADACVIREIYEETGYRIPHEKLRFRGEVHFFMGDGESEIISLFTGLCDGFVPRECREGTLRWIDKKEVKNLTLWEGDKVFLNKLLEDDPRIFCLYLYYDAEGRFMSSKEGDK